MPPMINDSAITGILATTKNIPCTIAVMTFPIMTEKGDIPVVIIMSKVWRSFSPDMEEAVRTGVTMPRMTN